MTYTRRPARPQKKGKPTERRSPGKRSTSKRSQGEASTRGKKQWGAKKERRWGSEKEKRPKKRHHGPWQDSAYSVSAAMPKVTPKNSTPVAAPIKATAASAPAVDGKERLQKVLARAGVASRRKAELLILEGAVTVNGRPTTELGTKVNPLKDKIKVKGKLIFTEVEPIYLALYKPKGVISSLSDPEGRRSLGDLLADVRERVIPVGRLDYNSEGLLLLTNDGELAEKILKTRTLPKIYMVKVKGHPTEQALDFFRRGIFTAEGVVRFTSYALEQSLKNKSWLKLEVTEGSRLDLRELLNHRGLLVDRIVRTAIGNISIKGLEPGQYIFLKRQELERLLTFSNDK